MNFKKTWKRANDGFTLVELIVVIAILAILAGVAVPAYSGYIEKANKAADQQVLAAVNTAFAAACLDNHVDFNEITNAVLDTSASGDGLAINGLASVTGGDATLAAYKSSFNTFMEGTTAVTKATKVIKYVPGLGFVDPASAPSGTFVSFGYGSTGATIYLTADEQVTMQNSTFGGMGATGVQTQLGKVTDFAASMDSNAINTVYGSDAFVSSLAKHMGVSKEEAYDFIDNEATDEYLANAAVLFAAESSKNLTTNEVNTLLTSGNATQTILDNLYGTNGAEKDESKAMAQAAVSYGMFTAYVNQLDDDYYDSATNRDKEDMINLANNPIEALGYLNDAGFQNYMKDTEKNGQAQKDLDAYLSALNAIDSTAQSNTGAAQDLLDKGFGTTNTDLTNLINGILTPADSAT